MYVHIPFCESLCTFCGCNTVITKNHNHESPYVKSLLSEWQLYEQAVPALAQAPLQAIHLGGGTPTFLSADNLQLLLRPLLPRKRTPDFEASIEIDPRRTTYEQLAGLRELGFNRVSLGVQDFNSEVQTLVNRMQPYSVTAESVGWARTLGYSSVNFDLIYGLPRQTLKAMQATVAKTLELRPDRLALYSLALVPWIKPAQRLFKDSDLPDAQSKRELYEYARQQFLAAGYQEIGMDHFALPTDALALAARTGRLHRNFMGYTDRRTDVLLGLGVSAISESPGIFHQNEKVLAKYTNLLEQQKIPSSRGHILSVDEQLVRQQILQLMTTHELDWSAQAELSPILHELVQDGLVELQSGQLRVTAQGKPFIRNVCAAIDQHYQPQDRPQYSRSI